MARKFDVTAMGNAIVDVIAPVDDAFLLTHKIAKGVMTLIDEFRAKIGILPAAEAALVDDVIDPRDTRRVLIQALDMARERRPGHAFKRRGITPI